MPLVIEHVAAPTSDARALIQELEAELGRSYSENQRHGYDISRIFQPNIRFFVARLGDRAVGCGGVAFEAEFAEVKRMYVRPESRGQSIGRMILGRLEQEALARGIERMVLETGDVLCAAIRLYEHASFTRCGAFGSYANMTPDWIARSVFMQKWIGRNVAPSGKLPD